MLVSEYVEIILTNRNLKNLVKRYDLSKNLKEGDIVKISIDNLSKSSHYYVVITCDYCNKELKIPFKRYNLSTKIVNKSACSSVECSNQKIKDVCQVKYGVDNPFQSEKVKIKTIDTLIGKYGVSHPMFLKETKDKIKETCFIKYGVDNYTKTEECKEKKKKTCLDKYGVDHQSKTTMGQEIRKMTRIENGLQIPDHLVPEYRKYRLEVNRMTNKIKNSILEIWDGNDYYDDEYIKDNFSLNPNDRNFPHFDHKISVIYGFKNNISPELIGDIDNICITKQWINGMKREKCEEEFKKEFIIHQIKI